jgi:hypothetical protein
MSVFVEVTLPETLLMRFVTSTAAAILTYRRERHFGRDDETRRAQEIAGAAPISQENATRLKYPSLPIPARSRHDVLRSVLY